MLANLLISISTILRLLFVRSFIFVPQGRSMSTTYSSGEVVYTCAEPPQGSLDHADFWNL